MLESSTVVAVVAVRNIAVATQFYGNILGLTQTNTGLLGVTFTCGGGRLFVYKSLTAGTNQGLSATFEVEDIEIVIEGLKRKGVVFEHHAIEGNKNEDEVIVVDSIKLACFKDPDGNLFGLSKKLRPKYSNKTPIIG